MAHEELPFVHKWSRWIQDGAVYDGVCFQVRDPNGVSVGANGRFEVAMANASDASEQYGGTFCVWAITPDGDALLSRSTDGATDLTPVGLGFAKGG